VLNNLHGETDKSKAFIEIQRVLNQKCKFLMLEPLRNLRGFFTFTRFGFWPLLSRDKWFRLLREAGFVNIQYSYENGIDIFVAEKPMSTAASKGFTQNPVAQETWKAVCRSSKVLDHLA
jgi:hypothetical protein